MSHYNSILADHVMKNYIGNRSAKGLISMGGILIIDEDKHEYYGTISVDYLTSHALNSVREDELVIVIKKGNVRHVVVYNITKLR